MTKRYHSRKYAVDEAFFDRWSPEMAYVLGFWFADGYMRKERSYRILFISNDRGVLEAMRSAMKSEHPIRKQKGDNAWNVSICSKRLYFALARRGGIRAKSRTITFPDVPPPYIADFIRGYFDGDGSVFYVDYISTKNHKPRTELRSNFTSGSRAFLEKLMAILYKKLGLTLKKIGSYNQGRSLKLGYAMKDTRKLLAYLYYPNHSISLQRKARFAKVEGVV